MPSLLQVNTGILSELPAESESAAMDCADVCREFGILFQTAEPAPAEHYNTMNT
jgi:hypothetical protein